MKDREHSCINHLKLRLQERDKVELIMKEHYSKLLQATSAQTQILHSVTTRYVTEMNELAERCEEMKTLIDRCKNDLVTERDK